MTTVLVTGGAGFIGSHTCKALRERGHGAVTFDNLERGHAQAVQFGPMCKGDMLRESDLTDAFRQHRPEAVMHFAAYAYVGESVEDPLRYYRNNVVGFLNVLEAVARFGIKKIVFSSTCATYGIPDELPIREHALQRPINPYGASKLVCERMLLDMAARSGLSYAVLRYFNAAGADATGLLPERHNPETHLIPLAIDAAMGAAPPLQVYGVDYDTADGTCERDYIHVTDLAEAHVAALEALDTHHQLITNLGAGRGVSVQQVLQEVERVVGRPVPHVRAARRPGDPPRLVADTTVARQVLGFEPRHSNISNIIETALRSRFRNASF
jgi:UDP-arabinose 4-epimerase